MSSRNQCSLGRCWRISAREGAGNDLANLLDLSLYGLDMGQVRRCAVSKSKSGWLKIHRANWGRGPAHTQEPPIVPSAWEKMLREMQLSEAQVLAVLKDRKGDTAMRIVE